MVKNRRPPWQILYPFTSRVESIDGRDYHYVDEFTGNKAAGTLLFVHGNPTWSFHWRELILACRSRYRCIAVDHAGCGLSDHPDGPLRLADHINNLVTFLDSLHLQEVTLVAQDWGGAIGLGALLRRRENFSRVVLFNTGAFRPWFIPWRIRLCRAPVAGRLAVQGANLFVRAALRMTLSRKRRLPPPVVAGYLAPYATWGDRRTVYDFVQDIPGSERHPTWRTLEAIERELPSLDGMPILLVWGMRDWCFTPACLEKFSQLWPQAEVHPLADVGHWVVEDAPDESLEVTQEFLSATDNPVADATRSGEQDSTDGQAGKRGCTEKLGRTGSLLYGVRNCVRLACLLEATAAKPGNVHPGAPFDDLRFEDLAQSANAISKILQHAPVLGVGKAVFTAVRAMRAAVGTNAYLGTILLLAPLACVPAGTPLRSGVIELLPQLDASHTRHVYDAIRLANPGGLGVAGRGDVHARAPRVPLVEAMSWAAERDLVARQYANQFDTVFAETADLLEASVRGNVPLLDAIIRVHVQLIATHGDSLIARKCGPKIYHEARTKAADVLHSGTIGCSAYREALAEFDAWLRADGHRRNPGTTADLLAAGLFVLLREGRLDLAEASRLVAGATGEIWTPP